MIAMKLICGNGHEFASYFRDRATCDRMIEQSLADCPHCGDHRLHHGLNAPAIHKNTPTQPLPNDDPLRPLHDKKLLAAKKTMRDYIAKNYDNVGYGFAETAKQIHYGETPAKNIYGKITADDANNLAAHGIAIAPLPFMADD